MTYKLSLLLLVFALCVTNIFAQNNITIQPQTQIVEKQDAIINKKTPKVTPFYEQVTKTTPDTKATKPKTFSTSKPLFKSASRPSIYKNLDKKIADVKTKIATLKANPDDNTTTLIKYEALLQRLQEIKTEAPVPNQ